MQILIVASLFFTSVLGSISSPRYRKLQNCQRPESKVTIRMVAFVSDDLGRNFEDGKEIVRETVRQGNELLDELNLEVVVEEYRSYALGGCGGGRQQIQNILEDVVEIGENGFMNHLFTHCSYGSVDGGPDSFVTGMAFVGNGVLCRSTTCAGVSLTEEVGQGQGPLTFAHEVGHQLGAEHVDEGIMKSITFGEEDTWDMENKCVIWNNLAATFAAGPSNALKTNYTGEETQNSAGEETKNPEMEEETLNPEMEEETLNPDMEEETLNQAEEEIPNTDGSFYGTGNTEEEIPNTDG